MAFFKALLSRFKKSSFPKEIEVLNNSCDTIFKRIFDKCRRVLGKELIDVINIKKNSIENLKISSSEGSLKSLLVIKILALTETYLQLAENYANCLEGSRSLSTIESTSSELINTGREKLTQIASLLKSLNIQLNLNSDRSFVENTDEIINEALALNNVLDKNYKSKL
ncbi:MAG: hypothetical protein ACM3KR_05520 [Deltaproteobacteria bacterium]